jgi:hypothetical protein
LSHDLPTWTFAPAKTFEVWNTTPTSAARATPPSPQRAIVRLLITCLLSVVAGQSVCPAVLRPNRTNEEDYGGTVANRL